MSAWYEKAVFYHIYPLGLLGAPKENTERKNKNRPRTIQILQPVPSTG